MVFPQPLWAKSALVPTLWSGTLHFILHTFLNSIFVFFHSTCSYHRKLFCCSTEVMSSSLSLNSLLVMGTQPFYCWSGICPGPPGSAGTRKVKPRRLKPIWIYWRDSEWQWHLLGYMQVCTPRRQPRQHPTTQFFLQAGCPSWRPTNSVKALKEDY